MSDFRPRSSSEILDASFEIYRRYFAIFLAINVFAAIPWAASAYVGQNALILHQTTGLFTSSIIRLLGALVSPFTEGAMACAASAAYLGDNVDLQAAVRAAFTHPGRLFLAMVTKGVFIGLGLILLLVPGLVMFKRYFAVPMTVLFEDNKVGASMTRSRELSNGNGGRIFGLIGGVYVFTMVVTLFLTQSVASIFHGAAATAVATLLIAGAITPFVTIVSTLLYYDIRIRREGYDIELMAQALGATAPAVPNVAL